ncbi:AAA family ATPase [Salinarimonas chemoclinalis]|uniref:AAA family ATPase n=1 Tax=Salinarimonas chemoclinalis TaxID=3241599 RepID=UPI003557107E
MRILAIRGENLASLAEPFEIDFGAAPLAAAGLFAITGETGAGKSTLLDALCLALYDEFPRVKAEGANEQIPDGENPPLSATDPRTILRRGAGRGFAEVDFAARDGAVYRVRCELNRARGKATGALQKRGRALWKLVPEGGLDAVASGVVPVRQEVERLTDLTCDQFRRTVLLAQGDFDAFLRADARERAELLEKITGTEIYATLSRRAFEHWRETKTALEALEARRAGIGLLAPEDRAAHEAEIAALVLRKAEETAAREAVEAGLRRHETIATATAKRDAAAAALAERREAAEALTPERARQAALERAEPLRGTFEREREAAQRLSTLCEAAAETVGGHESAAAALVAARIRAEEAQAARAEAEAACERLAPVWEEAAALDRRLADAADEARTKTAERDGAHRSAAEAGRAVEDLAARIAAAQSDRAETEAALAADAGLARLADGFEDLAASLAERTLLRDEITALRAKQAAAFAVLEQLAGRRSALDAADAEDAAARDGCDGRLAEKTAALDALDAASAVARLAALDAADRTCARLSPAAERARDASDALGEAQARRTAAAQAGSAARDRARDAETALSAASARADEVSRLADRAEASASANAAHLRATLVPGEPCPVCGAREHPRAEGPPDAVVAEIRARRATLVAEQEAAREALVDATAAQAAAERDGAAAEHAIASQEERLAAAARAYAEARASWQDDPVVAEHAPPEDWPDAVPRLAALARAIGTMREEAAGIVRRADALRADIDAERRRRDAAAREIEARRAARAALEAEERTAREGRLAADTSIPDREGRLVSIDREWTRVYEAAGLLPADLDRDPEGARRLLAGRRDGYLAQRSRLAALDAQIAADREARSAAEATALAATAALTAAETAVAAIANGLATLREARAGLLGGEETRAHKARHVELATKAREAFEAARTDRDAAAQALAVAHTRMTGAQAAVEEAVLGHARAEAGFAAALAASGLAREDALALLAIAPEAREALRARLAAADEAVREAASQLGFCEAALADALAAGTPEEDVETLAGRRRALHDALTATDEALVAARVALEQDDRARTQAGQLEGEIAAAAIVEKLWHEVSDAIGSADGSKFRRFAQSVTLDHLVALANRHLAALAPRYRLERAGGEGGGAGDLGLQILDRELGDARRSTRSLSGGERFLTSLALALALCSLEGRGSFVDTLFIDEGFGTLDAATLDVAIDALETLQAQGRKVGVISHVEAMHQRIPVQIRVEKAGGGRSRVRVTGAGLAMP